MKYKVSKSKAVEMIIFSPLEKGVMIEPILIQTVIPKRYVPERIFKKWQSRITMGAKINTTTTSLITAAKSVVIIHNNQKKIL